MDSFVILVSKLLPFRGTIAMYGNPTILLATWQPLIGIALIFRAIFAVFYIFLIVHKFYVVLNIFISFFFHFFHPPLPAGSGPLFSLLFIFSIC